MFSSEEKLHIANRANLAPSVHNTQPTRWRFEQDGSITLCADASRFLDVGDPAYRDAGLSCGTALEGTLMTLAQLGRRVGYIEDLWNLNECHAISGHRLAARLHLLPDNSGNAAPDPLAKTIKDRFTWRTHFLPVEYQFTRQLENWAAGKSDVTLATSAVDIEFLAHKNDAASLAVMRDPAFRKELVSWMRLSRTHPGFRSDGLNLDALKMNAVEGLGAKIVLGGLFPLMDQIGLAKSLVSELSKTKSSSAIALFHRPAEELPIETGRAFYRFWLEMAALGFAAWPMAAVADDVESSNECCARFAVPKDHRLINVLRVGRAGTERPKTARLGANTLIL